MILYKKYQNRPHDITDFIDKIYNKHKYNICMRFKSLKYNSQKFTRELDINKIIQDNNLDWLSDAEFENAEIEIEKNTLIWHQGDWYVGDFIYGIWLNGKFYGGNFINGIWQDGEFFDGTFESGLWKNGKIYGGTNRLTDKK